MKILSMLLVLSFSLLALSESGVNWEEMEESGESGLTQGSPGYSQRTPVTKGLVLLIPDSNADVVGMYDPYDGTYLGDFLVDDSTGTLYNFQTPINAIQGPNDYIFVSDQVSDAVYTFDNTGNFVGIAAQTGLNNIRGIDFRDDTLFVTSGDDYVAMFSAPDVFAGNFIQDGTDPFDILFVDEVESGSALLCDIQGTTDNLRHYYHDGTLIGELFLVAFPEQVQVDAGNPGHYLLAGFSSGFIYEFTIDGTIINTWAHSSTRGIYRLGNGNLLLTDGNGVHEMDSSTGSIIETENTGSCRFIELVDLPIVAIEEESYEEIWPGNLSLSPNPFYSQLAIEFSLPGASRVEIDIYSIDGRVVRTLVPGTLEGGTHSMIWDGTSDSGNPLGQGVYLVRVSTGQETFIQKVNLLH